MNPIRALFREPVGQWYHCAVLSYGISGYLSGLAGLFSGNAVSFLNSF